MVGVVTSRTLTGADGSRIAVSSFNFSSVPSLSFSYSVTRADVAAVTQALAEQAIQLVSHHDLGKLVVISAT